MSSDEAATSALLPREEYVEQAYFFRALRERMLQNLTAQELLPSLRDELLSTTQLPLAVDFMAAELRHVGLLSGALARLGHYFAPFQTFVVREAEKEGGRFDLEVALLVLEEDAKLRAAAARRSALFLFQFECMTRNRLRYDQGLEAISRDPAFTPDWREWILTVRRQIGLVEFADLIYVRSEHYLKDKARRGGSAEPEKPVLFGEKEGKIAKANRRRDPLLMFAAFQRHLNYPAAPVLKPPDETTRLLPELVRRMERAETRIKLLEEEQKGGIDLSKFFGPGPDGP